MNSPFMTAETRVRRNTTNQSHLPPPAPIPQNRALVRSSSVHVHAANVQQIITSYHPRTHPRITAGLVMWCIGLLLAFFGSGSSHLGHAQQEAYIQINTQLQDVAAQRATLHDAHAHILQQLDEAKLHSTWWLHSERRTAVAELQSKADSIQSQLRAQYNKAEALGAAQRQTMGLWSDRGVQSVRSFFWQCFDSGKVFARRQSLFDAINQLFWMRAGDRSGSGSLAHVLQLVVMAVVNFTTGMMLTMVLFTCRLPGYIASFAPDWWSGLLFFFIALWCALSTVLAILTVLYIAGITAALSATNLLHMAADSRSRIGQGGPGRGPRGLTVGQGMGPGPEYGAPQQQLRSFYSFDSGLSLRHARSIGRTESTSHEY